MYSQGPRNEGHYSGKSIIVNKLCVRTDRDYL